MGKEKLICPKCGKEMIRVYIAIGGFPGHPHIHPVGPPIKYKCENCGYEEEIKKNSALSK